MKLLENMEELGGSIHEAIKQMVIELFNKELDDEVVDRITSGLGLSDMIALDAAYTNGDRATVKSILGTDIQLEYSMGGRGDIQSAASTRQAPAKKAPPQKAQAAGNDRDTSNYSTGVSGKEDPQDINVTVNQNDEEELEEVSNKHYVTIKELRRLSGISK